MDENLASAGSRTGGRLRTGADPLVIEPVHLRAGQINGCSPCVHAGVAAAKKHRETDERQHNAEKTW